MKTSVLIVHWIPRVLCMLAIMLVSIFALDSFSPDRTFWQNIGAFMIHMIPSFVLLAILIVAWKWELAGGIVLTLTGLVLSVLVYIHNFKMNHSVGKSIGVILIITFPFIVAGVLFIVSHYLKRHSLKT